MSATIMDLNEFCIYLNEQWSIATIGGRIYGEPYVWGGQHTHLTPSNYQAIIDYRERNTGGYADGTSYATAAKRYCKRLFDAGLTDLYASDCSGLGCYFWGNVKQLMGDSTADQMMRMSQLYMNTPKRGWWCFKVNSSGRAYHIGYMVDDTHTIEAEGRTTGVVKKTFDPNYWNSWGIPDILRGVIPAPGEPMPGTPPAGSTSCQTTSGRPEETISFLRIKVRGNKKRSVNVRKGPSTAYKIMFTAHGGESYKLLYVSPETGWYKIDTFMGPGYITNKTKYTEIIKED